MSRNSDSLTRWKPGQIVFFIDSADVDTVKRMSDHSRVLDLREPKKKWAATCSDLWLATTLNL